MFTNRAALRTAKEARWQTMPFSKASITTVAGRLYSMWVTAGGAPATGAAPGATAIAYDSSTTGALRDIGGDVMRDSSGVARILAVAAQFATGPGGGVMQVADRISGISGFSGITTGSITCNTVAPARYATGAESKGILAAVEIYTVIGTTGNVVSANSYTNDAGTAARAGNAVVLGGTGFREVNRLVLLPLQSGDTGVRTVETISRAVSTGTAGNFGVTTYKPLVTVPIHSLGPAPTEEECEGMGFILPTVVADACLFGVVMTTGTSTGIIHGEIIQGEEA